MPSDDMADAMPCASCGLLHDLTGDNHFAGSYVRHACVAVSAHVLHVVHHVITSVIRSSTTLTRTFVGVNVFFKKHKLFVLVNILRHFFQVFRNAVGHNPIFKCNTVCAVSLNDFVSDTITMIDTVKVHIFFQQNTAFPIAYIDHEDKYVHVTASTQSAGHQ